MLQNYFKIAWRNLYKSKTTTFINLIGLISGLASVLLIYLWVADEFSVDRFHRNDAQLYQVMYNEKTAKEIKTSPQTPNFMEEALINDVPEIELASVATPALFFPDFQVSSGEKKSKATGKFAGKDFFKLFSYPLIEGAASQVLGDKNSVVISESLAKKLYNTTENLQGRRFSYTLMDLDREMTISGVFRDVPANASEQFDFLLAFDSMRELMGMKGRGYVWNTTEPFDNYVKLKEGTDVAALNHKLSKYVHSKDEISTYTLFLTPYSDGYLYNKYENGKQAGGRIDYVILFSIIAAFILLIACINFINLSTSKASSKLKQVGIKKVSGASREMLIIEYLAETVCLTFFALLAAIVVAYLILPDFNSLTGKKLQLIFDFPLVTALFAVTFSTGILAGLYPAVYLSGFKPAKILKGPIPASFMELMVRKGLVVFQFTISVIFIIGVLVIYEQINFIQSKNIGYKKENLMYFDSSSMNGKVNSFLEEARKFSGVKEASSMLGSIVSGEAVGMAGTVEYGGITIPMQTLGVNYNMLETLGMKLMQGRSFSKTMDNQANMKWILNETAVKSLGAPDILGKMIGKNEIIGIVKDFHFQSLHEKVKPFAFRLEPESASKIWLRINPGKEKETIAHMKTLYSKFNPDVPFNFTFADDAYEAQYVAEHRVSVLAKYFTGLAIIISCLGVLGLAAFTTEKRRKEIGIRKVLGSSEKDIVLLLSKDFTKMVLLGICIAIPLSYYGASQWLSSFAYTIDLHWWYFALGGAIALILTWSTIGTLTIKAAKANPTDCLHHE